MAKKYKIEDAYFTEPEGLLRIGAKVVYGPEEPDTSYRLSPVTGDGITGDFSKHSLELPLRETKLKDSLDKPRWPDRGKPISTKDKLKAVSWGFDYRIAIPPKTKKGPWEYLYYGDFNVAFAQMDEMAVSDAHIQMEERVKDPLKGDSWVRVETGQRSDGKFEKRSDEDIPFKPPSDDFLRPGEDNDLDEGVA